MRPPTARRLGSWTCLLLGPLLASALKTTGDQHVDDLLCYMFKSAVAPTWRFDPLHGQLYTKASKLQFVDLRVIIPVFQRTFDFDLLMQQWDHALRNTSLSVQVKLVETGPKRLITDDMLRWPWLEYMFVPYFGNGGLFPKGLLYNIGFAHGARSKWVLFHDYEIAVPATYVSQIETMITTNKRLKWAQPYYGKRVCYLDKAVSEEYRRQCLTNAACHAAFIQHCRLVPNAKQGAPGGSILVHAKAVHAVGGYDDDIFFGYSPEDQFFWDKLATLHPPVYQDDATAVLFHLYHPPKSSVAGLHVANMDQVTRTFRNLSTEAKADVMKARRARFLASQMLSWDINQHAELANYCEGVEYILEGSVGPV